MLGGGVIGSVALAGTFRETDEYVWIRDGGASHSHTVENVTPIIVHADLSVADGELVHTVDQVTPIILTATLIGLDSHMVMRSTVPEFSPTLVVDDAEHGHTVPQLTVSAHFDLTVNDAEHAFIDNLGALEAGITVNSCVHGHTAESASMVSILEIDGCQHGHVADKLTFTDNAILIVPDVSHIMTDTMAEFFSDIELVVGDCEHTHLADQVTPIIVHADLSVEDAEHEHTADEVTLVV